MNQFIGIGNLTADPHVRTTDSGTTVCSFRIAVNYGWGDNKKVSFLHVVTFGKRAETCGQYLSKGRKVCVRGSIATGEYTNTDGRKVYTTDIQADEVEFLGGGGSQPEQRSEALQEEMDVPKGFESVDDDSLPFN